LPTDFDIFSPRLQEAVTVDHLGERDGGRHQESRPIDGVEADDILANEV